MGRYGKDPKHCGGREGRRGGTQDGGRKTPEPLDSARRCAYPFVKTDDSYSPKNETDRLVFSGQGHTHAPRAVRRGSEAGGETASTAARLPSGRRLRASLVWSGSKTAPDATRRVLRAMAR